MNPTELFPEIEPFNTGHLKVSPIHEIYYEECGNKEGVPILFVHGGPGGGISPGARRFFDPEYYRIILFDQRGAGKSKPHAELENNTTQDLIHDMEFLRKQLGVRRWLIFGGSWGSTLSLAYSIKHSERVMGLVLRGIFLCRPSEISWFYQEGASHIYPDAWEGYLAPIPASERSNLVEAYYKRLTSEDESVRKEAALAWSKWEASTSFLIPNQNNINDFEDEDLALAFARIECHYFINNVFFDSDNYILENIDSIRDIPCVIVQGRYDVVCPARSAWDLHKAWPEAEFHLIQDAGHATMETGISEKLLAATEEFKAIKYEK